MIHTKNKTFKSEYEFNRSLLLISPDSYEKLEVTYYMFGLFAGYFILGGTGHLNLPIGIGWFFLMRIISIFIVRCDIGKNVDRILWHEMKWENIENNMYN